MWVGELGWDERKQVEIIIVPIIVIVPLCVGSNPTPRTIQFSYPLFQLVEAPMFGS